MKNALFFESVTVIGHYSKRCFINNFSNERRRMNIGFSFCHNESI